MQRRLTAFTARAAAVGRSVFDGRLSYAAAQDDEVDWTLFDVVGIDYYAYHADPADHVCELRRYMGWGKPLAITEFGTCTYAGAPQAGGMGWSVVDYDKDPPEIKGNLVRSEHTQAAYLADLLSVFESMGLYAAMAFEFLTADAPHRPGDPLHDLDMASYAITKPVRDRPDDPVSPGTGSPRRPSTPWPAAMPAPASASSLPRARRPPGWRSPRRVNAVAVHRGIGRQTQP